MTPDARLARLDPQARALLQQMAQAAAGRPAPTGVQVTAEWVAAGRAGYHAIDALAGETEPVEQVRDAAIPGPGGPVPVRIYAGAEPRGGRPLVVYLHGGGFTAGDLDTHDRPLRRLANASGAVIVSVAYRLAPEHPYPAAVDDANAALRWAAAHAGELGADASRLVVAGDSAGGLLATVAALRARDEGEPAIARQVLLYPDTDLRTGHHHASWADNDGLILNRADKERALALYLPPHVDRQHAHVSPLLAPQLAGLPSALIVTAEHDPQRDEGEAYAARLREAGVVVELVRYPGMVHGFAQMGGVLDAGRHVLERLAMAFARA